MEPPESSEQKFEFAPHLSKFDIPINEFFASQPQYSAFIVGAYVFSTTSIEPRLLLLQRDLRDSFGGYWEGPGGSCETTDATLLHSLAREVLEETGLHVSHIKELVNVDEWEHRKGKNKDLVENLGRIPIAAKYSFIVSVHEAKSTDMNTDIVVGSGWEHSIKLLDGEHQQYQWVTEEEVRQAVEEGGGEKGAEEGGVETGRKSMFKFAGEGATGLKSFGIYRSFK